MGDIYCPYCNEVVIINHDDGYGYDENEKYMQCCKHCNKTFAFTTQVCFVYEASKAPCLNGAAHDYEETNTHPRCFRHLECRYCGDRKEVEDIEQECEEYINTLKGAADELW